MKDKRKGHFILDRKEMLEIKKNLMRRPTSGEVKKNVNKTWYSQSYICMRTETRLLS